MMGRRLVNALSPLLAIIIGLIITIVAGLILAQLYFSYSSIISLRPAASVEYADLLEGGNRDILAINLRNIGNVPIIDVRVSADTGAPLTCSIAYAGRTTLGGGNPVQPGSIVSITCIGALVNRAGDVMTAILSIRFSDGSQQNLIVQLRARSA